MSIDYDGIAQSIKTTLESNLSADYDIAHWPSTTSLQRPGQVAIDVLFMGFNRNDEESDIGYTTRDARYSVGVLVSGSSGRSADETLNDVLAAVEEYCSPGNYGNLPFDESGILRAVASSAVKELNIKGAGEITVEVRIYDE